MEKKKKIKIGVAGVCSNVGTTFLAVSLAFLLARREAEKYKEAIGSRKTKKLFTTAVPDCVSFVELGNAGRKKESVYFAAGLDKQFRNRRFVDFFQLCQDGLPINTRLNLHKGINWAVHRRLTKDMEWEAFPIEQLAGTYVIVDEPPLERIHEYDCFFVVIDPLPSKLFAGAAAYEAFCDAARSGAKITWIVNKDNEEVDHGEVRRFLRLQNYISVPLYSEKVFYRSQYGGRLPIEEILREKGKAEPIQRLVQQTDAGQGKADN